MNLIINIKRKKNNKIFQFKSYFLLIILLSIIYQLKKIKTIFTANSQFLEKLILIKNFLAFILLNLRKTY